MRIILKDILHIVISRGSYVYKAGIDWIVCHSRLSSGNCIYKNVSFPVRTIDAAPGCEVRYTQQIKFAHQANNR